MNLIYQNNFYNAIQGKINKVGRNGLLTLFFPRDRTSTQSTKPLYRKIHSSVISNTTKNSDK